MTEGDNERERLKGNNLNYMNLSYKGKRETPSERQKGIVLGNKKCNVKSLKVPNYQ